MVHSRSFEWSLAFLLVVSTAHADFPPSIGEVERAWRARHDNLQSFEYDCEITETLYNIQRYEPFDPFQGAQDGDPDADEIVVKEVSLGNTVSYYRAGNKLAYRSGGEQWDHANEARKYFYFSAAFDGKRNMQLLEGHLATAGRIMPSTSPDKTLTANTTLVPIMLWYTPIEYLERAAYQLSRASINEKPVSHDRTACLELLIPRSSGDWQGTMYVDPERDFIPLRFCETRNGIVTTDRQIRYQSDPTVGWKIAAWDSTRYTSRGNPEDHIAAKVNKVAVNEPISDDRFIVEFPVGTRLTEEIAGRKSYSVVLADDGRKPITQDDVGRIKRTDRQFNDLMKRIDSVAAATPAERKILFDNLRSYVRMPSATRPSVWELVEHAARQIHAAFGPAAALDFCQEFTRESDVCRQCLTRYAATLAPRPKK